MLLNRTYEVDWASIEAAGGLLHAVTATVQSPPLRWSINEASSQGVVIDSMEYVGPDVASLPRLDRPRAIGSRVVVSLIPTGIGCSIGGFAGDAAPVTALLAATADMVVTNPNAVNASDFINADDRVVYTEGYCLDLFMQGMVELYRPRANRVGVIVERASAEAVDHVFNVVNTTRAVYGVDVVGCVVTPERIGTRCVRTTAGTYSGTIAAPDVLVEAAKELVRGGANALAVTTNVAGVESESYTSHFHGQHPNPVGGAEAVVSHLLAKVFALPAAHAPLANFKDLNLSSGIVDARSAGEFVSRSGLACILVGLRRAPQIVHRVGDGIVQRVGADDVVAVIAPATALGSAAVLSAVERRIPVVAVEENRTVLAISHSVLRLDRVIHVGNYLEAAGVVMALQSGVALSSLRRPLATLWPTGVRRRDGHAREPERLRVTDTVDARIDSSIAPR